MRGEKQLQARKIKGRLFIVSAPSGSGKTTLCKRLVSVLPDLHFSISYTTRLPRPGEINEVDYFFVSREKFVSMIEKGEFIEWAEVYDELYGTSKEFLDKLVNAGKDVILDIDVQGAMQIKNKIKGGIFIFVLPPSLEILIERLKKRSTESPDLIEKRVNRAISEIQNYVVYDYVIINDIFEEALNELKSIVICQRAKTEMINPKWIEINFLKGR